MAAATCEACGHTLGAEPVRGFAFCESCGAPTLRGDQASPFDVLSVAPDFTLDTSALESRYHELSRRLHPDRRGVANAKRGLELSALLNKSYLALKQSEQRLEALLRLSGAIKSDASESAATDGKSEIPTALAEEYFELQEAVMEDAPDAAGRLNSMRDKLESQRAALSEQLFALASSIDWTLPASAASDTRTMKILEMRRQRSYVRSMLENLDKLRERMT